MTGFYAKMREKKAVLVTGFQNAAIGGPYTNISYYDPDCGRKVSKLINLPYDAIEKLCESANRTGKVIDFTDKNIPKLKRQYKAKDGLFAPAP